jgi:uroporphyrinogen decarboxylase
MDQSFDLKNFWKENRECFKPFSTDKPRVPLAIMFDDHFLLHLVPVESALRYYTDPSYTIDVHCRANDVLEREIGLRSYSEDKIYYIKGAFEVLLGTKRIIQEGNTPWLESPVESIDDVKELIMRAEAWDVKRNAIPDEWKREKEKLHINRGKQLLFGHGMNGPAVLACNMIGMTNLCVFMIEEPEVINEFFTVAAEKYIEFNEAVMLEDNGYVSREGLGVNDDTCYLFPPEQYERFCVPFLKKCFDHFAPLPHHRRRQHSDSNMPHIMPFLNNLGVNEVNFGPEIHPLDIRKALPGAMIHGQTPPSVLRNGTNEEIIRYVKRNFDTIGDDGGYVESLAGVIQESTPLENIRNYMHAVHTHTRYNK